MMTEVKTNLETTSLNDNKQKIKKIEYTMNRDRKAFEVLYKIIMTGMSKNGTNVSITAEVEAPKQNRTSLYEIHDAYDLKEYITGLEKSVEEHLQHMKDSTEKMSEFVMNFFENLVKGNNNEEKEEKIENKVLKKEKQTETKPNILTNNQIDTSTFFMNPAMYPFMYNPYNNWPFIAANVSFLN